MKKGFSSIDELLQRPTDATQEQLSKKFSPAASDKLQEKLEEIRIETSEKETEQRAVSLGLPFINLVGFPIGPEIISLIPEEEAAGHRVVAFFHMENQIRIGVVDPDDADLHDIIANLQHHHPRTNIELYLISQHSFEAAFALYKTVAKIKKIQFGVSITAAQLEHYQKTLRNFADLKEQILSVNMTDAFAMIISMALNLDASDVHLETEEDNVKMRFRIDGVLHDAVKLPAHIWPRLLKRIKAIAGLKINVTEVPQDGRITVKFATKEKLDLRVSAFPSAFGESIVMRLLKSSSIGLQFEDLGMRPDVLAILKQEMEKPNGMIITTGPTGSGKTTTLYAILNQLNSPETKIITLENPIEYKLEGIVQSQVNATGDVARGEVKLVDPRQEEFSTARDYTFAKGLRALLRQDPDIVMIGEIRDFETATTAVEAALTGHLMLSTIHTNDAAGAVPRFLGMGVKGIFLAPALNAVIGQRLVRRIHEACKEQYTPRPEEIAKMKEWVAAMPESDAEKKPDVINITFYRGKGCEACSHTGFKGRIGIYEIFTMSEKIEQQILSDKVSEYQMKELLREAGMITMGQDGMLKVLGGITTLDEVFRVAKE